MSDIEIAAQISDIKQLIFTQEWTKARDKCEAVLNDPRADDVARQETLALQAAVKQRTLAEKTIQDTLESTRLELAKPAPDYGSATTRLQEAIALGNRHYIQRWNSQLLEVLDEIKRRLNIQVRFKSEQLRFEEAVAAKNMELAIQIAQHMVEDAEVNQEPALAQAAREWIKQLGTQIQYDQLANSIQSALERDDFAGAMQLFEGLPPFAPRYNELSPLVEDARVKLQVIERNLAIALDSWKNLNPPQIQVTDRILSDLQRKYRRNWAWRPLYFEFYTYTAEHLNSRGDDYAAHGQFEEAAQSYKSAKEPQLKLAEVFEDDPSLKQALMITDARCEVCTALKEAQLDWAALNLDAAQARCKKVLDMLDTAPEPVKEATRILRQRTADYKQSIEQIKQAQAVLIDAENLPGDGDPADILKDVERVLKLGSDTPETLLNRARELQATAQRRLQYIETQIQQARTDARQRPELAFEAYRQAYQAAHVPGLQQEIVKHCLTVAEQLTNSDEKRTWYERALTIDSTNETVKALLESVSSEFEANLMSLISSVSDLENQIDVALSDLKPTAQKLNLLGEKVKAAPPALKRVKAEQQRLDQLRESIETIDHAKTRANGLIQHGEWTEAIAMLKQTGEALRSRRQAEQLMALAKRWTQSHEEAKAKYVTAKSDYAEALKSYQATPTTEKYDEAADLAQHSLKAMEGARASLTEGQPPLDWKNFESEVGTLVKRAKTLREAWSASKDPKRSLPEVVRALRGEVDTADPVMTDLIVKLTQRAVAECITKADEQERLGYDREVLAALEDALDLGGENPDLRRRISLITTREERSKRIKELRADVQIWLKRSGGVRTASKPQTELLRLLAEDIDPELVGSIENYISTVPVDLETALVRLAAGDVGEDDRAELKRVQADYTAALRRAEKQLEDIRGIAQRSQRIGQSSIVQDCEDWLDLKRDFGRWNIATSAAAIGELITATKNYLQLGERTQKDPSAYDYREEFENARRAMLDHLQQSVAKRQAEARDALDKGLYDRALQSLQEVETEFFEPIEREFRNYRREVLSRLEEKGTPLFKIREESRQIKQDVERLKGLAAQLEATETEIRSYWRQEPEKALQSLTDLRIDDPEQECKHIWKRLDRLAVEASKHQVERAAEMARVKIRKAEDDLKNALTVHDYEQIKAALMDINGDTLDTDYRRRREKILATLSEQVRIPELLQQAQEQLELDNLDRSYDLYAQAIAIRPDLSRDSAFKQKYERAAEHHRKLTDISTLKTEALDVIDSKPTEAAQKLARALSKAQAQQLSSEVEDIQRLLAVAKAREALDLANESLRDNDLQRAGRHAQEAKRFAEQGRDETLQWQAAQIANDMELVVKINIEAENFMRQRQWQKAIQVLQDTDRLPAHQLKHPVIVASLEKARQGYDSLFKLRSEAASFSNSGDFAKARATIVVAQTEGAISEEDAQQLTQSVQTVEDKTRDWRQQLDRLASRLPVLTEVGMSQVDEAIREARQLADQATVTGLHDRASALAESLGKLRQQLEDVNRVISLANAAESSPMDVLEILKGASTTLTLVYEGQTRDIRYAGSEMVHRIRQDAVRAQINLLKNQIDGAEEYPLSVLQGLLETCRQLEPHLNRAEDLTRFEIAHKQFELAAERKKIEQACEDWDRQIAEIDRLEAAKESNVTLLERAQKIQQAIEERQNGVRLMPEIWGRLDEVWQDVTRRRNRYEKGITEVIQKARAAMEKGTSQQVRSAELQCAELLKTITGPQRAELETVLEELRVAKKTLEAAERRLAEAKQQVRGRTYAEAVKTLDALPVWPAALRVEREALGKIVSEIAGFEVRLQQPLEIATESTLNDRLQEYRQTLERLQGFLQNWPGELLETEGYVPVFRSDLMTVVDRVQRALCQTTGQLAQLALNSLDVARARSLMLTARTSNWVTDNQTEFIIGIEHEIDVVQATLDLDERLTRPALDKITVADEVLTDLLKQPYLVSAARRLRALNTQKLTEAYRLVVQGRPEDIQLASDLLGEDPRLVELPAFRIINRLVNDARKEMSRDLLLIKQANDLIFNVRQAELSQVFDWLPGLKERAEKQEKIQVKLDEIRACIANEVQTARANLDFPRLRALNPLARDLGIIGQDTAALDTEQKDQLREALNRARQAIKVYAPEEAQTHLDTARRLSEGGASTEIFQLEEERKQLQVACNASDRYITEAESAFSTGNYAAAAEKYQLAVGQTPLRKRVEVFADSKHAELLRQFNEAAARQFYPAALEIADRSLTFKFRPDEWQTLRSMLIQQRDSEAVRLITEVTTALNNPQADLSAFSDRLKSAINWQASRHNELQTAAQQVERYLERSSEVRLDVRNGWPELDQGNFARALEHFRTAEKRLPVSHPEITNWIRFSEAADSASKQLVNVRPDLDGSRGGHYQVVYPGWDEVKELLNQAFSVMAVVKRTVLLGAEGEAQQQHQQARAWGWLNLSRSIDNYFAAAQSKFNLEDWSAGTQHYNQALAELDDLKQALRTATAAAPRAIGSEASAQPKFEPEVASPAFQPDPREPMLPTGEERFAPATIPLEPVASEADWVSNTAVAFDAPVEAPAVSDVADTARSWTEGWGDQPALVAEPAALRAEPLPPQPDWATSWGESANTETAAYTPLVYDSPAEPVSAVDSETATITRPTDFAASPASRAVPSDEPAARPAYAPRPIEIPQTPIPEPTPDEGTF